jgi:hypothetical protein
MQKAYEALLAMNKPPYPLQDSQARGKIQLNQGGTNPGVIKSEVRVFLNQNPKTPLCKASSGK